MLCVSFSFFESKRRHNCLILCSLAAIKKVPGTHNYDVKRFHRSSARNNFRSGSILAEFCLLVFLPLWWVCGRTTVVSCHVAPGLSPSHNNGFSFSFPVTPFSVVVAVEKKYKCSKRFLLHPLPWFLFMVQLMGSRTILLEKKTGSWGKERSKTLASNMLTQLLTTFLWDCWQICLQHDIDTIVYTGLTVCRQDKTNFCEPLESRSVGKLTLLTTREACNSSVVSLREVYLISLNIPDALSVSLSLFLSLSVLFLSWRVKGIGTIILSQVCLNAWMIVLMFIQNWIVCRRGRKASKNKQTNNKKVDIPTGVAKGHGGMMTIAV